MKDFDRPTNILCSLLSICSKTSTYTCSYNIMLPVDVKCNKFTQSVYYGNLLILAITFVLFFCGFESNYCQITNNLIMNVLRLHWLLPSFIWKKRYLWPSLRQVMKTQSYWARHLCDWEMRSPGEVGSRSFAQKNRFLCFHVPQNQWFSLFTVPPQVVFINLILKSLVLCSPEKTTFVPLSP